jgi:hypothetical protein
MENKSGLGLSSNTIDSMLEYIKRIEPSSKEESIENVASGLVAKGIINNPKMHNNLSKINKINLAKSVEIPLLATAIGSLYDAYQGRENANKIFGPNPTFGQRAASVGSSIANGVTFGAFDFNNPKSIRRVYDFYSN